jgi:peptide deformylase
MELIPESDARLHEQAAPVQEFGSALLDTMKEMARFMLTSKGCGIAGPQVGIQQQIAVAVLGMDRNKPALLFMVNPVVTPLKQWKDTATEGCLSFPGRVAEAIPRFRSIRLTYQRALDGVTESVDLTGFDARVVQHEVDHLNGVTIL